MGGNLGGAMVSVLMAVWNAPAGQLRQAVDSILSQSYRDFEFLIVDDGSTDAEQHRLLSQYAACDSRIRLLREPHRGLTRSLNRGLALAQGEFIARQDADDWSGPERLARQIAYVRAHPYLVLCGTLAWTHQENGRRLWPTRLPLTHAAILQALETGNPFVHGSTLFRRDAALALGGYAEEMRCAQDYDFFWRLAQHGPVANLAEPLYHYRYAAGSVSAAKAAEQAVSHRAAGLLAQARRTGIPLQVSQALDQARCDLQEQKADRQALLKQADHLLLAGAYWRAGRAYLDVLAEHPASPLAWGKLVRWGVFCTVPPVREACFR